MRFVFRRKETVLPTGGPFTESLATLPLHERESLLLGLMRLLEALLSRGDVQVQRMCWTCAHYNGDRRGRHRSCCYGRIAVAELRTDCPEHEAT
ncbi:MAG: hypothetical protein IPO05_14405 [Flavobacteriales bacterium]|nr:hypothetical protein [Flavobacteriales bacterium]